MSHFANVDYKAIASQNSKNLDATKDGGSIPFGQAFDVVVIGDGHAIRRHKWWTEHYRGAYWGEGQIMVKKGGLTDPGTLTVSGIGNVGPFCESFVAEVRKFSKKKIVFTR